MPRKQHVVVLSAEERSRLRADEPASAHRSRRFWDNADIVEMREAKDQRIDHPAGGDDAGSIAGNLEGTMPLRTKKFGCNLEIKRQRRGWEPLQHAPSPHA